MAECARLYFRHLKEKHKTVAAVGRAAGLNRTHIYEIIKLLGIRNEMFTKNEGNDAWKAISDHGSESFRACHVRRVNATGSGR